MTVLIKGVREGHVELFTTVGVLSSLRHSKHLFDELAAGRRPRAQSVVRAAAADRTGDGAGSTAQG